jgi:hypothetical protein
MDFPSVGQKYNAIREIRNIIMVLLILIVLLTSDEINDFKKGLISDTVACDNGAVWF